MFIAKDITQFKILFVRKLKNMLSDDELGAFILVLANSHQDDFLQSELQADLKNTFLALKETYKAGELKAPQDDLNVFEKLLDLELENMPVWQTKNLGDWELVYNSIRKFRPARSSSQVLRSIKQSYDETKFHFNKPFLKPEILWEGVYNDVKLRVLFNKFPFSDYHLLIVPSPESNSAQFLTQDKHNYAFSLVNEGSNALPGFGIGYNSLAAGASVNHFHFQGFIRQRDFSIEKNHWQHNGGDKKYPLEVRRFSNTNSSWKYLQQLTDEDKAFNCLYLNNDCYVVARKYQGMVDLPEWLNGAGWIDVSGSITVSDEKTFDLIDEQSVAQALALLSDK